MLNHWKNEAINNFMDRVNRELFDNEIDLSPSNFALEIVPTEDLGIGIKGYCYREPGDEVTTMGISPKMNWYETKQTIIHEMIHCHQLQKYGFADHEWNWNYFTIKARDFFPEISDI
jgi:hypothetical protein